MLQMKKPAASATLLVLSTAVMAADHSADHSSMRLLSLARWRCKSLSVTKIILNQDFRYSNQRKFQHRIPSGIQSYRLMG